MFGHGSSLLQITYNPQQDNIESDFHSIFIEKHCFYSIFLYIPKSYCISLVLSYAFFSNVETQVWGLPRLVSLYAQWF